MTVLAILFCAMFLLSSGALAWGFGYRSYYRWAFGGWNRACALHDADKRELTELRELVDALNSNSVYRACLQ